MENWNFFHVWFLGKKSLQILFADTLNRKEGFLEHKNVFSKKWKKLDLVKNWNFWSKIFGQTLEFFP